MKRRLSRLSRLCLLLPATHAGAALAQYKCVAANGAITFQQAPCVGARSEQKLTVVPNGHPPPASGAAPVAGVESVDRRMQAGYERQRQRDTLLQAVRSAQDDKARRAEQRLADIAGARKQFGPEPANAKLLSDALVSIDNRYKALAEIDDSRIRAAQAELDDWDRSPPPRP